MIGIIVIFLFIGLILYGSFSKERQIDINENEIKHRIDEFRYM